MDRPIKTCVLGVGLAGLTFHLPFVLALPEFSLVAVLERNPQTPGGKLQERFGVTTKIHRTLDAVLSDSEIELVIVGTPNETHYAISKQVLLAGKHVLVDKPIAATVEQAKELGSLAKEKNLVLYPFQNRRWDTDFLALRKLLDLPGSAAQSLGHLVEFESRFDRYRASLKGTWKDQPLPANGLTYDLGSHLIDQTLVLFGRPEKLTAFCANVRGIGSPEVDDCFTIILHYARSEKLPYGLTAFLRAHILSARSPQVRYVVRGTKATFSKFGVDPQEDMLKVLASPRAILTDPDYGIEPQELHGTVEVLNEDGTATKSIWPSSEKGSYAGLFRNLAAVIRDGEDQAVKWDESAAVIELIELALQSSKEGKTLIVPKM